MQISAQRKLYEFLKDELGSSVDIVKVDSNLASIINILSQEDLSGIGDSPEINSFEILRKIEFNDLLTVQPTIDDYKIYYTRLDEKYREFDRQGANKSLSVLAAIRKQYVKLLGKNIEPYEMFFSIIDNLIEVIMDSKNYVEIPYEELEMCASILVVDAFIRCKIFKNPEAFVLEELKKIDNQTIMDLYQNVKINKEMSFPTFMLCLDWLYLIEAVKMNERGYIQLCL